MSVPREIQWLFWDVDVHGLDRERDTDFILARVLERGRLSDVRWAMSTYGLERIHSFFRDVGHPDISPRTISFWRAFFGAEHETWQTSTPFRASSSAPWVA